MNLKNLISALLLLTVGCATAHAAPASYITYQDHVVEARPLPKTPEESIADLAKTLPQVPPPTTVVGLSKGDPAPFDGILLTELRAATDGQYRISYKELRLYYAADRVEWNAQRMLYEQQLLQASQQIQQMTPGWFQVHALELGFVGGFVLGTTAILLISKL